eukprot:4347560-Pyramimonas_sp.AAC.1
MSRFQPDIWCAAPRATPSGCKQHRVGAAYPQPKRRSTSSVSDGRGGSGSAAGHESFEPLARGAEG